MPTTTRVSDRRAWLKSQGGDLDGRHQRSSWSLPVFAACATIALLSGTVAQPFGVPSAAAASVTAPTVDFGDPQKLSVEGDYAASIQRDVFGSEAAPEPEPEPVVEEASAGDAEAIASGDAEAIAPVAATPDPGTAQAIARDMLAARGMGEDQFGCLSALWHKESGWNINAHNASSGAHGIPQALPGSKMASAGADWQTNPATQITWGLGYIEGRYGTPCGAWAMSQAQGWY